MNKAMNNCYTFNISTNTFLRKENMNHPRIKHGIMKMAQKIFVFGGVTDNGFYTKSAEVYDVVQNSWKNLPDMPIEGRYITCVSM